MNDVAIGSDGRVYASNGDVVTSLDRLGTVAWSLSSSVLLNGTRNRCAFFTSPAVGTLAGKEAVFVGTAHPNSQLIAPDGSVPTKVLAIDYSGQVRWVASLPWPAGAKPQKVQCSSVALSYTPPLSVYVGCSFDDAVSVYRLDAETGTVLVADATSFKYDSPVPENAVGEVLPSLANPGILYVTTEYQFFSCDTSGGSLLSCWSITYPAFAASFRLAESPSGSLIVYTYNIQNNTLYTVDRTNRVFDFTQIAGNEKFTSDGSLAVGQKYIYTLEKNQLVCLDLDLKPQWVAPQATKSSPGSGLVMDAQRVYVYESRGVFIFHRGNGTLVKQISDVGPQAPPLLNYFVGPSLASGPSPTLFVPADNRVVSLSLGSDLAPPGTAGPGASPVPKPTISGGTLAALVIISAILGSALFAGIWYFNSQREAYGNRGRLPLI